MIPAILAATMTGDDAPIYWVADLAIFAMFGMMTAVAVWSWHPSWDRFWARFRRK